MNLVTVPPYSTTHTMTTSANGAAGSSGGSPTSTASNQLNANSFITLLTAQVRAQDPLNPLDPNQMMNELVSMNSLQQLIGIKQDLDNLTGATAGGTTPSGSS